MKCNPFLSLAGMVLAVSACRSPLGGREPAGSLQVYTSQAWRTVGDEGLSFVHTDYEIHSPDGKHEQAVQNFEGNGIEPPCVSVPVGPHVIVGLASGRGTITAPVTIEPGRVSIVRLDEVAAAKDHKPNPKKK